jgi:hypothetical protein
METIDHLLIPRFRVIAEYPNSPFKVGDIIEMIAQRSNGKYFMVYSPPFEDNIKLELYEEDCQRFHKIFEELLWHEALPNEKAPKYLKRANFPISRLAPIVFKVYNPYPDDPKFPIIGDKMACVEYEGDTRDVDRNTGILFGVNNVVGVEIDAYVPATEKDYLLDQERITLNENFQKLRPSIREELMKNTRFDPKVIQRETEYITNLKKWGR